MEAMTPEERFTRIENLLSALTEHQAQHKEQMAAHEAIHNKEIAELRDMQKAIAAGMIELQQTQRVTEQELRALAESTRTLDKELREAQKTTEEKLHILIDTVDRIIRGKK
jgi:hypothetical protein